jgi:hypothetical protein
VFRTGDYHRDPGRDISEEIETHLELKIEELVAAGLSEQEARAEAARRFGNRAEIHAEATGYARKREGRKSFLASVETFLQDGRYALRTLSRAPGMTTLTILIESANPAQGRLRGRTDEALIVEGVDKYYTRAAKLDLLYVPFGEEGSPLAERVDRHVQTVSTLFEVFSSHNPDRTIPVEDLPSLHEVLQNGLGALLAPPGT